MASKGQKFKQWTAEEKYKIIKPALELEKSTWDITRETGLSKFSNRKNLSEVEQLQYENMKLRIENERLKKGYLVKGDGSVVMFRK